MCFHSLRDTTYMAIQKRNKKRLGFIILLAADCVGKTVLGML